MVVLQFEGNGLRATVTDRGDGTYLVRLTDLDSGLSLDGGLICSSLETAREKAVQMVQE